MMGTRSRRGWLTKESLRSGLKEQAAWTNVGMDTHTVTLERRPLIQDSWRVIHTHIRLGGYRYVDSVEDFDKLTAARERFKKEAAH